MSDAWFMWVKTPIFFGVFGLALAAFFYMRIMRLPRSRLKPIPIAIGLRYCSKLRKKASMKSFAYPQADK